MAVQSDAAVRSPVRWSPERAWAWQRSLPWMVGCNFNPASSVNQLEMWQADTFDIAGIDRELGWAAGIGMNTARVFLHDLLWDQDNEGFIERIESYLAAAWRHGVRTMFVLFDSCWAASPALGMQPSPRVGIHNSGWVQSPGTAALADPLQLDRLERYVRGVVSAFSDDPRILAWDIWNEPDNEGDVSTVSAATRAAKADMVVPFLSCAFDWVRACDPVQPLTCGVWFGDWASDDRLTAIETLQVSLSDVTSFHNYGNGHDFSDRVRNLERFGRPIMCTEYMARGTGSTFESILPLARAQGVAAINWGLVSGKTQTHLPWSAWTILNPGLETGWFHDIFHWDGRPYCADEVQFIRNATGLAAA